MHAKVRDALIVEGRNLGGAIRHDPIEEVHSTDGTPPYLAHWTDTGHRALTCPGPDAHVVTPTACAGRNRGGASVPQALSGEPTCREARGRSCRTVRATR
nr:DUF1918 domain-containing protein [Nocardia arthritidis]